MAATSVNVGSGATFTLSGAVTGAALTKLGSGTLPLTNAGNAYASTTILGGYVFAPANTLGNGSITLGGGSILDVLGSSLTNTVLFTTGSGAVVNSGTYVNLSGTGSIASGTGTAVFKAAVGGVAHAEAATGTVRINGDVLSTADINANNGGVVILSGSGTFASPVIDNAGSLTVDRTANLTLAALIQGTGSLTKQGTGVLDLTGANSYSGLTTVSAGGLKVNGLLGSGSVSITNNAWLGGSGTIAGPVFMSGTLSPGNSPGLLTVGSLALDSTSTTLIEFTDSLVRGTGFDGVTVTNPSGLSYGGILSFAFGNTSAFADNTTFDIFAFTGSTAGAFSSVASTGYYEGTWTSNNDGTFSFAQGSQTLTFSQATGDIIVVPEPGMLALVGIALAGWRMRRRRS